MGSKLRFSFSTPKSGKWFLKGPPGFRSNANCTIEITIAESLSSEEKRQIDAAVQFLFSSEHDSCELSPKLRDKNIWIASGADLSKSGIYTYLAPVAENSGSHLVFYVGIATGSLKKRLCSERKAQADSKRGWEGAYFPKSRWASYHCFENGNELDYEKVKIVAFNLPSKLAKALEKALIQGIAPPANDKYFPYERLHGKGCQNPRGPCGVMCNSRIRIPFVKTSFPRR